jgi:hypothetical protein
MSPLFRDLPQLAQRMARWRAAAARFGRPEADALRLVLSERSIIDKVGPDRLLPSTLWHFLASTQSQHKQHGRAGMRSCSAHHTGVKPLANLKLACSVKLPAASMSLASIALLQKVCCSCCQIALL